MGKIEKTFQSGAVLTAADMNNIVKAVNDNDENKLGKTEAAEQFQPKGTYLTAETDPTVPSWAKTPEKPTYTAEEVGAVAKGGLKTINGESLEGEGNIEIQGSGGGIADAPSDGKKYVRQNGTWTEETQVNTSDFATKTELEGKLSTETYESEKATFATKEEIPSLDGYMKETSADAKYQAKGNYALKSEISDMLTKTEAGQTYATKAELGDINAVLDTINGEVI